MLRSYRKPLIVMTPKSLLRHKFSISPLEELSIGGFKLVISDDTVPNPDEVRRIVFCSGKVYYDLSEARQVNSIADTALVRIEQLYPFPVGQYAAEIAAYPNAVDIVWCQEEPQNQGAWYQIRHRLQEALGEEQQLYYAGRPGAAAPASGIFKLHMQQQQALVEAALNIQVKASKAKKPASKKRK
jgi:2-oxoglutarate dehydrogenase E1 component